MYQTFSVSTVDVDKATKQILVAFTNDVEPASINHNTVYVSTGSNGDTVKIKWSLEGTFLTIDILNDIEPNQSYFLFITTDVVNILGEHLSQRLKQEFIIENDVRNSCEIISPVNYEYIPDNIINISLQENKYDESSVILNTFYLQVSSDHLFENIINDIIIQDKSDITISLNTAGQVYIRARVQKDEGQYGSWSKVVVVNLEAPETKNNNDTYEDIAPIFKQEIGIISEPEQGETPKSFIIEFDCELDEKSIDDAILVLKRSI